MPHAILSGMMRADTTTPPIGWSPAIPAGAAREAPSRTPAAVIAAPGWFFLGGWTAAWIGVGVVVAAGISFGAGNEFRPVLVYSVLFALVVGFSAYTSARLAFPITSRLPFALRLVLNGLTVLAGTIFGQIVVIAFDPLYLLAEFRVILVIVAINTVLATIVAVALATYDRMRSQIESSHRILREREALERQLDVARDVQLELLPHAPPTIAGLEVVAVCRQAVAVGGDYYDFLPLGNGHFGLIIADISGKGVPAALLMASLQASTRSLFPTTPDPAVLAGRLNEALCQRSPAAHYATAFVASYVPETRRLTYCNAGHLPPLILRHGDIIRCHEGGIPIGLLEGMTYESAAHTLHPEDLCVLFTDGVTEAASRDGEEFGDARLADLVNTHRERPLETVREAVLDALEQWGGSTDARDDATIVLVKVL